ncbi:hypothetical protein CBM2586_A10261 [Cupriavidus phytorum]|uniref:Uncharacterized protein n=1 Tax=Cupriavidus taiwanensis TaxID=164546 RepID=A0A375B9F8_9BURK|nr:hypothetical protein CBM2586_A10261 [Cupriavidus taiwanensis]
MDIPLGMLAQEKINKYPILSTFYPVHNRVEL